tara:strand:- start:37 stop:219 length:183 start_codon:yes stop_codon:yes gene_type:complete
MEKTWLETHNNNLEQMKKAFDKWNEQMEVKREEIKANEKKFEGMDIQKELQRIFNTNGEK